MDFSCLTLLWVMFFCFGCTHSSRIITHGTEIDYSMLRFDSYHHYPDLVKTLHGLAEQFPNLARTGTIGQSVEKRNLMYLEISKNVATESPGRPKIKLVGNMHGDETIGRQILIYLAQYLLRNYDTDERSRAIVDDMRIFIMPSMNPDGFERAKEGVCDKRENSGRLNANSVDLNKNFPDQFDTKSEAETRASNRQPETSAIIIWILNNHFVLSGSFHAATEVVSYPFDNSASGPAYGIMSPTPDNAMFKYMARTYADKHLTMHKNNGKKCGDDKFDRGVTNGAQWYAVSGGMGDYNYVYGNCFEVTIELTCCKYPYASELENEWNKNKEALLSFVELAKQGVWGFVRDGETGAPIEGAIIKVKGVAKNVTSSKNGDYWRLLVPGEYRISANKDGYQSQTKTVTVTAHSATESDFVLLRKDETTSSVKVETAMQLVLAPTIYDNNGNIGANIGETRLNKVATDILGFLKILNTILGISFLAMGICTALVICKVCRNKKENGSMQGFLPFDQHPDMYSDRVPVASSGRMLLDDEKEVQVYHDELSSDEEDCASQSIQELKNHAICKKMLLEGQH